MTKEEMIEEIIGLVKSIKATRAENARIKKNILEKMHELEGLQHKREVREVETEMKQVLS